MLLRYSTVWVILKWFHPPVLLPVSLLLFTFYMPCVCVLMSLYFRMFSASWSHSCLLKWWHLLAYMFTFHHHHHHGGIGNVYLSEGSQAVPACPCGKVGSRRVLKNALCIVLRQWRPVENEKGYQYSSHVASTVHVLVVQFICCQYSSLVANTVHVLPVQFTCCQYSSRVSSTVHVLPVQFTCCQYSSHVASTVHVLPVQFTCCQYSSHVASTVRVLPVQFACCQYSSRVSSTVHMLPVQFTC